MASLDDVRVEHDDEYDAEVGAVSRRLVELVVFIATMEERRGDAARAHALIRAVASGAAADARLVGVGGRCTSSSEPGAAADPGVTTRATAHAGGGASNGAGPVGDGASNGAGPVGDGASNGAGPVGDGAPHPKRSRRAARYKRQRVTAKAAKAAQRQREATAAAEAVGSTGLDWAAVHEMVRGADRFVVCAIDMFVAGCGQLPGGLWDGSGCWDGAMLCHGEDVRLLWPRQHGGTSAPAAAAAAAVSGPARTSTTPTTVPLIAPAARAAAAASVFDAVDARFDAAVAVCDRSHIGLLLEALCDAAAALPADAATLARLVTKAEGLNASPDDAALWCAWLRSRAGALALGRRQSLSTAAAEASAALAALNAAADTAFKLCGPTPKVFHTAAETMLELGTEAAQQAAVAVLVRGADAFFEAPSSAAVGMLYETNPIGDSAAAAVGEALRRYQRLMGITVAMYQWKPPELTAAVGGEGEGAGSGGGGRTGLDGQIGLSLRLCYCLLLELTASAPPSANCSSVAAGAAGGLARVRDAYEWGIGSIERLGERARKRLWCAYIRHTVVSTPAAAVPLLRRCLQGGVVSYRVAPRSCNLRDWQTLASFWPEAAVGGALVRDFSFHNSVFRLYLELLPEGADRRSEAYREMQKLTPGNDVLVCRAARWAVAHGERQYAAALLAAGIDVHPRVPSLWQL
jgi:hypothetical protein